MWHARDVPHLPGFSIAVMQFEQGCRSIGNTHFYTVSSGGDCAGDLGLLLKYASQLPRLRSLDLTNAYISGSIPNGLSFPYLTTLFLGSNFVSVRSWSLVCCWAGLIYIPCLQLQALAVILDACQAGHL